MSVQAAQVAGKRLELLRETVPRLRRLAVMCDPSRCVGVSGRAGGAALAPVRGPARHRAAVARRRPPRGCEGAGDARGSRAFAFVLMVLAHRRTSVLIDEHRCAEDQEPPARPVALSIRRLLSGLYGGADMPLTGQSLRAGPHCRALYSVTYSRLSKSDSNIDVPLALPVRAASITSAR
jgi:hypothetical protein